MNKKIKIIELLNKIANGEEMELPKRIKCNNHILEYIGKWQQYIGQDNDSLSLLSIINDYNYSGLTDEVEVLEDNTEEIEELYIDKIYNTATPILIKESLELCQNKINELVKAVNSIRKDKNND